MNCANNGCGGVIQWRHLIEYAETECPRRKVSCQYCQLEGGHHFIEGKHKDECAEYPLRSVDIFVVKKWTNVRVDVH